MAKVTIEVDDMKLNSLKIHIQEKQKEDPDIPSIEDMVQAAGAEAFDKAYHKYVPKQIRSFIDKLGSVQEV